MFLLTIHYSLDVDVKMGQCQVWQCQKSENHTYSAWAQRDACIPHPCWSMWCHACCSGPCSVSCSPDACPTRQERSGETALSLSVCDWKHPLISNHIFHQEKGKKGRGKKRKAGHSVFHKENGLKIKWWARLLNVNMGFSEACITLLSLISPNPSISLSAVLEKQV